MSLDYDVAICGAGPAGMAFAAMLAKRGVPGARIALIDAKTLEQASADPRTLALSHGSQQILEHIGAWPIQATDIHEIHVSRRGQFGRSMITREDEGVPALGHVARYGDIVTVLGRVCTQFGIGALRPARVAAMDEQQDHVVLTLDDGRSLRAAIVVQAEGGLFGEQSAKAVQRDYGQSAIIAQVQSTAPVAHRAYERFTHEGPLALLPQGEEYSMVWCVSPGTAETLLALDDAAFLDKLGEMFGQRVGRFSAITRRLAFPLGLNAGVSNTPRIAAIGNAAQTLHPVAGQGLNLGLRDAAVLARLLAQDASPERLAEYGALRRRDRDTTVRLTDTMARIFANNSPAQGLLGLTLAAIDLASPARSVLAELMMYGRR